MFRVWVLGLRAFSAFGVWGSGLLGFGAFGILCVDFLVGFVHYKNGNWALVSRTL